jgi:hypothetical protein
MTGGLKIVSLISHLLVNAVNKIVLFLCLIKPDIILFEEHINFIERDIVYRIDASHQTNVLTLTGGDVIV